MKYRALTHIHHDDQKYVPGDEIELTTAEAAQLQEVNAIEPYHKPFSKKSANETNQGNGNV